ncbi:MAG: NADH-quinone oxidoreductase subunit N, partial [Deltaproteobacteria bacterium]|nr:NADH-quinone oxidoreductase subunit N [Deltaproteobacteria bacterium]
MDLANLDSLKFFYPELVLVVTILLVGFLDLFVENKKSLSFIAAAGALISLGATLELSGTTGGWLFYRMVVLDNFSLFFKVISLLAVLLVIWMSMGSREIRQVHQGEYYTVLLTSALGMFFMASSSNLLMAYLSLELVSITSYILTGMLPRNRRSSEAALKYLIYGGVASGSMIYGMSWVFGLTGSLDYAQINQVLLGSTGNQTALFIALVFILAGFGYKVVIAPFHMWSPDVYQGAPTPITAFLSVGSNAAGIAIMIRFFVPAISRLGDAGVWTSVPGIEWSQVL